MEDLISQFTLLSNPSSIQDLTNNLFDIEAYRTWACLDQQQDHFNHQFEPSQQQQQQQSMDSSEQQEMDSTMQDAMQELTEFQQEMEREAMEEYHRLISGGDGDGDGVGMMMGLATMAKDASLAASKCVHTALANAATSMKNVWKGIIKPKVHPC